MLNLKVNYVNPMKRHEKCTCGSIVMSRTSEIRAEARFSLASGHAIEREMNYISLRRINKVGLILRE
jgi:hypothetical protein